MSFSDVIRNLSFGLELGARPAIQKMPPVSEQKHETAASLGGAKRQPNLALWIGIAFAVSLGLAVAVLATRGINEASLRLALRLTARWSFAPFWLAYTGSALAGLFGRAFAPLAKRGREFGLAFAAALAVHLGVVIWLSVFIAGAPLSGSGLAFFLTGAFFTYLLAVFSFGGLAKALGPSRWRGLRFIGVNYILCAFARDFLPGAIDTSGHYGLGHLISYAPFAAMTIVAPLLVIAAAMRRRLERGRQVRFASVAN